MVKLFHIFAIPVYFHWSTAFILLAIIPLKLTVGYLTALGLILLHEAGHLIAAKLNRHHGHAIEIYPYLGIFYCDEIRSRKAGLWIYSGGIVAQLIVFGIALSVGIANADYLKSAPRYLDEVMYVLVPLNLLFIILNLLPIHPLDGWFIRSLLRRERYHEPQALEGYRTKERRLRSISDNKRSLYVVRKNRER